MQKLFTPELKSTKADKTNLLLNTGSVRNIFTKGEEKLLQLAADSGGAGATTEGHTTFFGCVQPTKGWHCRRHTKLNANLAIPKGHASAKN